MKVNCAQRATLLMTLKECVDRRRDVRQKKTALYAFYRGIVVKSGDGRPKQRVVHRTGEAQVAFLYTKQRMCSTNRQN